VTQNSSEYKWTRASLLEGKPIGCLFGYPKRDFNSIALNKEAVALFNIFQINSLGFFCLNTEYMVFLLRAAVNNPTHLCSSWGGTEILNGMGFGRHQLLPASWAQESL